MYFENCITNKLNKNKNAYCVLGIYLFDFDALFAVVALAYAGARLLRSIVLAVVGQQFAARSPFQCG